MADYVRWCVIAEAFLLTGFAAAVMMEAKKFRVPPRHVWWISTSYVVLALGYAVEIWGQAGQGTGVTFRLTIGLVAFSFGIVAMVEMYRAYSFTARAQRHARKAEASAEKLLRGRRHDGDPPADPPTTGTG